MFSCDFYKISKNNFFQNTSGGCFFLSLFFIFEKEKDLFDKLFQPQDMLFIRDLREISFLLKLSCEVF